MTGRIVNRKNKDGTTRQYLQIIKSYRLKGKKHPRQKVLASLGRVDELQNGELDSLIKFLSETLSNLTVLNLQTELFHENSIALGQRKIFDKIWQKLNLDTIFRNAGLTDSMLVAVKTMVLSRLEEPCSKRATQMDSHKYKLPNEIDPSLTTYYNTLDKFNNNINDIENQLFTHQYGNFDQVEMFNDSQLSVVFLILRVLNCICQKRKMARKKRFRIISKEDIQKIIDQICCNSL